MASFSLDDFRGKPAPDDCPPPPKAGHKFVVRPHVEPTRPGRPWEFTTRVLQEVPHLTDEELRDLAAELTDGEWERLKEIRDNFYPEISYRKRMLRRLMRRSGPHKTKLGNNPLETKRSEIDIRLLYEVSLQSMDECSYSRYGIDLKSLAENVAWKLTTSGSPETLRVLAILRSSDLRPPGGGTYPRKGPFARRMVAGFLHEQGFEPSDDRIGRIVTPKKSKQNSA